MKVALFGTSADPPTLGHLAILRWLTQHYDHVAVWAADNPFKPDQIPLYHRNRMMQLLVTELGLPPAEIQVYPDLSHPRTLITVDRARQRWPEAEFTVVVGADILPQLPKWYQAQQLFQQVHFVVVPRPGYHLWGGDLDRLRQLGAHIEVAELATPNVSSTAYRQRTREDGVPTSIQSYIQREQLYGWQDAHREKIVVP